MARRRRINYWSSRSAYGCWIDGRQHLLARGPDDQPGGPTYLAAVEAYQLATESGATATVRGVVAQYLAWLRDNRSAGTVVIREDELSGVVAAFGDRLVSSLTAAEVGGWVASHKWGASQQRLAIDSLRACLSWGAKQGVCAANQLSGIERPPPVSRGEEAYVSPAEFRIIVSTSSREVGEFVKVLYCTGARPGEIRLATGAAYRDDLQGIVYKAATPQPGRHKTQRHGKDRVILLQGEALDIVRRRVERYGEGPLFPAHQKASPRGRVAVVSMFVRIAERVGFPVTAYSLRHSYCTDWLLAGKPVDVLAELVGSSPNVIRRHYQHLFVDVNRLRGYLDGFRS